MNTTNITNNITNNSNNTNTNINIPNLLKKYQNLNYFDQYGGSVLLCIFITIILLLLITYCLIMKNVQPIINDWPNQRCKLNIIPFAGLITRPTGVSILDYTKDNFTYCAQNILTNISEVSIEPLTYVVSTLNSIATEIEDEIQSIRTMINTIRNLFQEISQEIMGRIMNCMIPLQQIIISFKDLIAKVEGSMTAALFTLFGSYYTLQSLMGAIVEFIIGILIALSAIITIMWILPFTWGAAAVNTAIYIAIAVPLALILAFMMDFLHIQSNLSIPTIKCFDKNTLIKMNNGKNKKIKNIKIGDILFKNNSVTGFIKVTTKGSDMYNLNNIIVSGSHLVKYENKWILTSDHPSAIKLISYDEPYLYCLNTNNKTIQINNITFMDWDEIDEVNIIEINNNYNEFPIHKLQDIHIYLDSGFKKNTNIKLHNQTYKQIKDIKVGDLLENEIIVYGIVIINGNTLNKQFKYNLGNNIIIEGGPTLLLSDNENKYNRLSLVSNIINKHNKLYHLLTNKKYFYIENHKFYDYNANIDLFLEKNKKNYNL
jgi:hypothetical protein